MDSYVTKQGASLAFSMQFAADDGSPFDLTGAVVTSTLRDLAGNLVAALPITLSTASINVAFVQVADTSAWPLGQLAGDITVTRDGLAVKSTNYGILVQEAQTP